MFIIIHAHAVGDFRPNYYLYYNSTKQFYTNTCLGGIHQNVSLSSIENLTIKNNDIWQFDTCIVIYNLYGF